MIDEPAMRCDHANDLAAGVDARAQAVVVVRPIHVVLDVLLARPDHLDRPVHLLRDLHGAHRAVELESAAEAAAQQVIVDAHLLALQAGQLHDGGLRDARDLRADPDVAAVLASCAPCSSSAPSSRAPETAARRRRRSSCAARAMAAAASPSWRATTPGFSERRGELRDDVGRRELGVGSGVPLRIGGRETLLGRPGVASHDRHRVVESDDLGHAGHGLRLRLVHATAAFHRRSARPPRPRISFRAVGCRCRTSRCRRPCRRCRGADAAFRSA